MFKNMKRSPNTYPTFNCVFEEWTFHLEGYFFGNYQRMTIHLNKHEKVSLITKDEEFYKEDHDDMVDEIIELEKTSAYREVVKEIELYEKQMKEKLKVKNVKILGRFDDCFVVGFRIDSPISTSKQVTLIDGRADVLFLNTCSPYEYFYLILQKDGAAVSYDELLGLRKVFFTTKEEYKTLEINKKDIAVFRKENGSFFTHQNFLEDITKKLISEPSIRLRILMG